MERLQTVFSLITIKTVLCLFAHNLMFTWPQRGKRVHIQGKQPLFIYPNRFNSLLAAKWLDKRHERTSLSYKSRLAVQIDCALGHFEAILYSGSHGTALAANLG